jgi:hypothetical protein
MCKLQILMNSEGTQFWARLWNKIVRGQGTLGVFWSDDVEILREFHAIRADRGQDPVGRAGVQLSVFSVSDTLTSMVNRS